METEIIMTIMTILVRRDFWRGRWSWNKYVINNDLIQWQSESIIELFFTVPTTSNRPSSNPIAFVFFLYFSSQ